MMSVLFLKQKDYQQLPGCYKRSVEGHKRILAAIKDKDPKKAEEAMMEHLHGIEAIVYSLQQTEGKDDENEDSNNKN